MIVRFLKDLSLDEMTSLKQSDLWKIIYNTYLYTSLNLSYEMEYYGYDYIDYSLIVFINSIPILACFAYCKHGKFQFFESPGRIISHKGYDYSGSVINTAHKLLLQKLNTLFIKEHFTECSFFYNPFFISEFCEKIERTDLEHTAVIDLTLSEAEIKSNIRKSYKSLVNWGEKNLIIKILDSTSFCANSFSDFKKFHIATSGRQTRNDKTWDLQADAIKNNEAYLILGYFDSKLVSGSFILYGNKTAAYGVGVYDRELMAQKIPLSHFTIMKSVLYAKSKGLALFDLGLITPKPDDEKYNNIAKFKKGFSSFVNCIVKYTVKLNME
jgi:hypothetical protein